MTTSSTTTLHAMHLTSEPICLLKTAVATVANKSTQVDANILFDEGSQRSFATQALTVTASSDRNDTTISLWVD